MRKVAIIGSGFGALALAIRLQARGFDVNIFEKNGRAGGHASQFTESGFTFDMGPSLVTAPEIINDIFKTAGKKTEDYLEMIPLDPFYRIHFHDKSFIDYTGDSEKMKQQMAGFNEEDAAKYDEFIEYSRRIYDSVITDGLGATPFNKLTVMLKFLPRALKLNALSPAYKSAAKFFKDFRHRFMFSFHPLFIGGNPFNVPGIYLMISYLEKKGGVWFTRGGMYSLVEAFEKLFRELGGKVNVNSPVEEIVTSGSRATGVKVEGNIREADIIVSNADTTHTFSELLKINGKPVWSISKIKRNKYSMSTVILYLGVKKKYPELLHHTLILSPRYEGLVNDIFEAKILPNDFSMYLHVPSRTDKSMAPEGCESIYILIPVANKSSGIDWSSIKEEFTGRVIQFLEKDFGLEGLEQNLIVRRIYTTDDFEKERNSWLGTPWGMEPILTQSAYFRPHNKPGLLDNFYLVGAGTHPGAGLPGVMLSAEATEKMIMENSN